MSLSEHTASYAPARPSQRRLRALLALTSLLLLVGLSALGRPISAGWFGWVFNTLGLVSLSLLTALVGAAPLLLMQHIGPRWLRSLTRRTNELLCAFPPLIIVALVIPSPAPVSLLYLGALIGLCQSFPAAQILSDALARSLELDPMGPTPCFTRSERIRLVVRLMTQRLAMLPLLSAAGTLFIDAGLCLLGVVTSPLPTVSSQLGYALHQQGMTGSLGGGSSLGAVGGILLIGWYLVWAQQQILNADGKSL